MQQPKKYVTRMRGQLGSGLRSNEVVKGKDVPTQALPKASPTTKKDKKKMQVEVKIERVNDS
jgi:hypothetical protein